MKVENDEKIKFFWRFYLMCDITTNVIVYIKKGVKYVGLLVSLGIHLVNRNSKFLATTRNRTEKPNRQSLSFRLDLKPTVLRVNIKLENRSPYHLNFQIKFFSNCLLNLIFF